MIRTVVAALLLFIMIPLHAQTNNSDTDRYRQMLSSLEKERSLSQEQMLQKLLLEKLIAFKDENVSAHVSNEPIKNLTQYTQLFMRYLHSLQTRSRLSEKQKSLSAKIAILKSGADKNSSDAVLFGLQSAYYTKMQENYLKQLNAIDLDLISIAQNMDDVLGHFPIDKEKLRHTQSVLDERLKTVETQINQLTLQQERVELLHNNKAVIMTQQKIQEDKQIRDTLLLKSVVNKFLYFSYALTQKDEKVLLTENDLVKTFLQLDDLRPSIKMMQSFLLKMDNHHLGGFNYTLRSTLQDAKEMAAYFWHMVTQAIFTINGTKVSILKLIISILIFIAGFFIGGFYKAKVKHIMTHRISFDIYTRTILANIGYYLIILMAFFIALNVMGINLSSIALVAGALSVGIGFGLQNIVSNFVSGIILMFERNIKVDDYVQLADGLEGRVMDIKMRSTTINTNANIDVIVPNQNFIQSNVINWTMNDNIKRFEVPFDVAYGTKPEFVIKVVLEAVQKSGFEDIITTPIRFTRVAMTSLGDSGVNYSLFVWLKGDEIRHTKRTTSRFLILIYNACYENGIEIPFPQRDLHVRSVDQELLKNLKPLS